MPAEGHYSDDLELILAQHPRWMVRRGLVGFLVFVLVLFALSWIIRYPDVIRANLTIVSEHPPASVTAQTSGKIDSVFVADKQFVQQGQALALIENTSGYADMQQLKTLITACTEKLAVADSSVAPLLALQLPALRTGELAPLYSEWQNQLAALQSYCAIDAYDQRITLLTVQENSMQQYLGKLSAQAQLLTNELELAKSSFRIDSTLFASGAIAQAAYNTAKSVYLLKASSCAGASSNLLHEKMQLELLQKEAAELRIAHAEQLAQFKTAIKAALEKLRSSLDTWELKYVLKSPVSGTVQLFTLRKNKTIKQSEEVLIVSPLQQDQLTGELSIPLSGSAKVKPGQEVNIKLADYPFEEFGQLHGIVSTVSLLAKDSCYAVTVRFPEGLRTSMRRQLSYRPMMTGSAEIITQQQSVLQRVLGVITGRWK